ncbi:MAG: alpha/beta fold hydrolase [Chloroflexota bacterium]
MPRLKRILSITAFVILLLIFPTYVAFGLVMHGQLTDISNGCRNRDNRPDQFSDVTNYLEAEGLDLSQYFMETYETVIFTSREDGIMLSGWYIPGNAYTPAIINLHGLGSCKYSVVNLMQAGMLNNAGYSVLMMDVRDAGDSDYEDGRSAIGNEEYLDALGGFDWLQTEKKHDTVAVLGNSLGAATALIAFAQEPKLAAAFVDSPFDNLPQIIQEELVREGYPPFLYASGLIAARMRGDNIAFNNPHDAINNANGRPIFVTHGTADTRIGVHHTEQLAERASAAGENVSVWIIDDVEHVKAVGKMPIEYEKRMLDFFNNALN